MSNTSTLNPLGTGKQLGSDVTSSSAGKLAATSARVVLGLAFTVFGLNGFLNFLPMPPHEGASGAFLGALAASGYMFPLIKGTELLVGLSLLTKKWVPLALVVLAPVTINIVAFHAALEPASIGLPVVLMALHLALGYVYRASYRALFV